MKTNKLIETVTEHFDVLLFGTRSKTFDEMIEKIDRDKVFQSAVKDAFGKSWARIREALMSNEFDMSKVQHLFR